MAVRFDAARVNTISVIARVRRARGNLPSTENYRPYLSFQREKIASAAARPRKDGRGRLVNRNQFIPLRKALPEAEFEVSKPTGQQCTFHLSYNFITEAGRRRNTVWYSLLDGEWPEVKARLEQRLQTR